MGYRLIADKHLIPALGHIRLDKLTPEAIQAYYTDKLRNGRTDGRGGLSARTVNHHHKLLGRIVRRAYRLRKIPHNVMDFVEAPRGSSRSIACLSLEEVNVLIKESSRTRYFVFVVLASDTGMRRSELLGLQWQDIDLKRRTISVERGLHTFEKGRQVYQPPKSESSRRRIDLAQTTCDLLERHKAACEEMLGRISYETPVFCVSDGFPWKGGAVSHGIKKLLRKIGRPDVSLHGLRHSTASNMLSLGIHMKVVQELLGHSDFGVTMNIYTHVSPGLQVQAVNQLAEARAKAGISTHFQRTEENVAPKGVAI